MLKRAVLLLAALATAALSVTFAGAVHTEDDRVRLPIVMYHHMSEKQRLWGDYVLSPEQFEGDLKYLRDNGYTSVTVSELIAWSEGGGELPDKPVMITFDDAYESTAVYALPLLEKYGMTAVVSVIGSVAQQYTDNPDHMLDYSHMSWESVAEAAAGGVADIQCHTWDMHRLSPRRGCGRKSGETSAGYAAALSEDISRFQESMTEYTGAPAEALALPYGFYTGETLEAAGALGFRVVFTCTERVNLLTGAPEGLMELCRYNRHHGRDSAAFFSQWEN